MKLLRREYTNNIFIFEKHLQNIQYLIKSEPCSTFYILGYINLVHITVHRQIINFFIHEMYVGEGSDRHGTKSKRSGVATGQFQRFLEILKVLIIGTSLALYIYCN